MEEVKAMLQSLVNVALKAKNEAGEDDKEKDKEKEDKKAENEAVDKRDIIRQIMAIAGKREDDEDVRTIAKLAEKLAYDKSEAKTADNKSAKNEDEEDDKEKAKNKCKNEDEEKKEKYEDFKEEIDKTVENAKAKNSLDAIKKIFFEGSVENTAKYMSQKDGIALGKKLY